jgi:hypothetical protein
MRFGFDGDGLQTAVIAVVSALPAAVRSPVSLSQEIKGSIMYLAIIPATTGPNMKNNKKMGIKSWIKS